MPFREIRERLKLSKKDFTFIPEDVLLNLFSQQAVEACLISLDSVSILQVKGLATDIVEKATRTFAILVYNNHEEYISKYLEHDVNDGKLPLSQAPSDDLPGAEAFLDAQWSLIAPKLEKGKHMVFDCKTTLPFVSVIEPLYADSGAHSTITKVFIRASHQNFFGRSCSEGSVAAVRKTIPKHREWPKRTEAQLKRDFEREKEALWLIAQRGHPAIVELLYSYKYEDQFHFLFPLAEMNLKDLFEGLERPPPLKRNEDLYRAIGDVAGGLEAIHQLEVNHSEITLSFIGNHYDLKPNNILVHGGRFLLADFGNARFNPVDGNLRARVREAERNWSCGTGDYFPPERDAERRLHTVNPCSADLWSFGCILLELLIYAVKGCTRLRSFREERGNEKYGHSGDSTFHVRGRVKTSVSEAIRAFCDTEPLPSAAEGELLGLSEELLNPSNLQKRLECQVEKRIRDILARHPSTVWDLEEVEGQLRAQGDLAALHLKALTNDESGFSELLDSRGSVELETEDEEGRLPLHWAALGGHNSIVELICSQDKRRARRMGRTKDKGGHTPLSIAARGSRPDVFRTLLSLEVRPHDAGHPMFLQDDSARAPLHHAAEVGCSEIVEQIIDHLGERSDGLREALLCKDKYERIPLHYAAEVHFCGAAAAMLRSHPDLRERMLSDSDDKETPVDCANRVGNASLFHSM